jgi:hypothetical protein
MRQKLCNKGNVLLDGLMAVAYLFPFTATIAERASGRGLGAKWKNSILISAIKAIRQY